MQAEISGRIDQGIDKRLLCRKQIRKLSLEAALVRILCGSIHDIEWQSPLSNLHSSLCSTVVNTAHVF